MARFPPAAYFLDPNLTAQTSTSTHTRLTILPVPLHPCASTQFPPPQPEVLLCRTSPLKLLHRQNPSWPIHFHHFSCTNPNRPHLEQPPEQPPTTVISRRTSTPSSSSLLLPASCPQQTATNRQLPLPQPAVRFPQHPPIPHQPPTNNHTIAGNTSTSSPHLLSLCQNSPTLHLHFHPPSAAHHATGVPRHLLAPLPPLAPASQIHAQAPQRPTGSASGINRHATTTVHPLPKRPPPSLSQALQQHSTTEPLQPVPPATGWPPAFKADLIRQHPQWHHQQPLPTPTHPWPAQYSLPTQQPTPFISPQTGSSTLSSPPPVVTLRPPTIWLDAQGRPLPLSQQDYDPVTDPWHADNH